MIKHSIAFVAAAGASLAIAAPADAALVVASNTAVTSLGSFGAGTYSITASGVISLTGVPGEFDVGPDGIPVTPVTAGGYAYCNLVGCSVDVPGGGTVGPGGLTANFGSVLGTLTASPTTPADFFNIGAGTTFTLVAPGTIYALVNDTFYGNNTGSFNVTVAPVPEPATWALMLMGFGLIGYAMRGRRRVNVQFA